MNPRADFDRFVADSTDPMTTPAGVSTQTFNLPSGCNTNKDCSGGNTVVDAGATGGHAKGETLSSSR